MTQVKVSLEPNVRGFSHNAAVKAAVISLKAASFLPKSSYSREPFPPPLR